MSRLSRKEAMHPLVFVGALSALVALASRDLWPGDLPALLDRLMLAASAGMLLWALSLGPPPGREGFQCADDEPRTEDTSDIDGLRPKLYSSVFGPEPVTGGAWGRLHINQERTANNTEQSSADLAGRGLRIYNRSLHAPPADKLGLSSTE